MLLEGSKDLIRSRGAEKSGENSAEYSFINQPTDLIHSKV